MCGSYLPGYRAEMEKIKCYTKLHSPVTISVPHDRKIPQHTHDQKTGRLFSTQDQTQTTGKINNVFLNRFHSRYPLTSE